MTTQKTNHNDAAFPFYILCLVIVTLKFLGPLLIGLAAILQYFGL